MKGHMDAVTMMTTTTRRKYASVVHHSPYDYWPNQYRHKGPTLSSATLKHRVGQEWFVPFPNETNYVTKISVYPRTKFDFCWSRKDQNETMVVACSLSDHEKERPRSGFTYIKFRAKNSCVRDVGREKHGAILHRSGWGRSRSQGSHETYPSSGRNIKDIPAHARVPRLEPDFSRHYHKILIRNRPRKSIIR